MRYLIIGLAAVMLLAACGEEPIEAQDAEAFDPLPDQTLMTMAVVNPESAITAMDGYAAGVPLLGSTSVSGWLLAELGCASMTEVESRYGIDADGTAIVYMESMMPQSFGAILSLTDPELFWNTIGMTPVPGEPLLDNEVGYFEVDFGKIYVCSTRGLLLAAGSRAGLEGMLERLDGQYPAGLPGIPDGSIYISADIATFGPMAAQQLMLFRPQILSEMQTDGEVDMEMMSRVMDLYFDAFHIILTQTESVDCVISMGQEHLSFISTAEFVAGSDLAQVIVPAQVTDMTTLIPAGDVAIARVCIDPVTSEAMLAAVMSTIGLDDLPEEMITFWSQASSSMAMSMFTNPDNPLNIVAVYHMPEGSTLLDVLSAYQDQFSMMSGLLGEMPGVVFNDVTLAEYDGMEWVTFGMEMNYEAMTSEMETDEGEEVPLTGGFSWTAWLTEADGVLYMEMNEQPVFVPALISGTWDGEFASSVPEMGAFSDEAEFALLFNLPAYLNTAMSMSGMDLPGIESAPVWVEAQLNIVDGGIEQQIRVNGASLVAFIAQAVQTFGSLEAME